MLTTGSTIGDLPTVDRIIAAHEAFVDKHGRRPAVLEISNRDSLSLREECRRWPSFDVFHCVAPPTELDPYEDADGRTFNGMRIRVREGDIAVTTDDVQERPRHADP